MAFRIVVGYDGSPGAKAALDEGIDLARRLSGTVAVTYAYGGPKSYAGAPLTPRRTLKELGQKLLAEALAQAGHSGVAIEPVLVNDSAAAGLQSVADKEGAVIIVVGSRGESPISGMLLGSTAYRLVHTATKPVLVVPVAKRQRKAA